MKKRQRNTGHAGIRARCTVTTGTLAAVVTAGMIGVATPAVAQSGPPEHFSESMELSGQHFLSDVCGVPIVQEGTLDVHVTVHPDGVERIHQRLDLTLTGNGKVAREQPSFNVTVDPSVGTATIRGSVVNIHADDGGQLLKDVGRLVRDLNTGQVVERTGRWDILDGNVDTVCSYFGAD